MRHFTFVWLLMATALAEPEADTDLMDMGSDMLLLQMQMTRNTETETNAETETTNQAVTTNITDPGLDDPTLDMLDNQMRSIAMTYDVQRLDLNRMNVLNYEAPKSDAISHFITDTTAGCFQGHPRAVEGALALKKAGPHGQMFLQSRTRHGSCPSLGYELEHGKDSCYPGVATFVADEYGRMQFEAEKRAALKNYASMNSLTSEFSELMGKCTCHPESESMTGLNNCDEALSSARGVLVHRHNGKDLVCQEGRIRQVTFALATMKSSHLLPMHLHDQVQVTTCDALGFKEHSAPDFCYPDMSIATKSIPMAADAAFNEYIQAQNYYNFQGFQEYVHRQRLNQDLLETLPGCECLPKSQLWGSRFWSSNRCDAQQSRSPVRDWFM